MGSWLPLQGIRAAVRGINGKKEKKQTKDKHDGAFGDGFSRDYFSWRRLVVAASVQ